MAKAVVVREIGPKTVRLAQKKLRGSRRDGTALARRCGPEDRAGSVTFKDGLVIKDDPYGSG